jgi:hypothetical protein
MQFLLLVCIGDDFNPSALGGHDTEAWVSEMSANGVGKVGDRLQAADDATTVRVRAGELTLIDDSEVDLQGAIAGFDLIDGADLKAALDVVARHPMATAGRSRSDRCGATDAAIIAASYWSPRWRRSRRLGRRTRT